MMRSAFARRTAGLTMALAAAGALRVLAQDAPIGTAAPDPAGLSPPVVTGSPREARIDPGKLKLAQQIFEIAGAPALRVSTRSLATRLSVQLAGAAPGRDEAHAKAMTAAVDDGLTSLTPELQVEAVSHIAREFTLAQLQEMLSFYDTPTGRLAGRRLPLITQQTVGAILTYLPRLMAGIEDSYCSRVTCTRAERKAFDDIASRVTATRAPAD